MHRPEVWEAISNSKGNIAWNQGKWKKKAKNDRKTWNFDPSKFSKMKKSATKRNLTSWWYGQVGSWKNLGISLKYNVFFCVYEVNVEVKQAMYGYSMIAFDERVTSWLSMHLHGHCLVRVRRLHCMCVQSRNGYTQASHASNATYAHAQGCDRMRWSQKFTLFWNLGIGL